MKIAICTDGDKKDSEVSDVFGRCRYFGLYDTDDKSLKFVKNPGDGAARGAGIKAGQLLINEKVDKVYCGNIGPNAERVIKGGNIDIEISQGKTVKEIIKNL